VAASVQGNQIGVVVWVSFSATLGTAGSSFGAVSFNYNVNGKHRTHCRCVIAAPLPFRQQIVE
jgi:hypothetical protein